MDKRLILVFAVVTASIGGAIAWRLSRPPEKPRIEVTQNVEVRSLVVLLSETPAIDKAAVSKAMSAEFGLKARVTGDLPLLTIHVEGHDLLLHVEKDEYSLDDFEDFDLQHSGWIAVDDNTWSTRLVGDSYPVIARVLAALWPESAAAVLHPQTKQWVMVTGATREKLREPEVINALFRREQGEEPIPVKDTDPALVAARDAARKRWPEFVQAFRARKGQDFIVKAPITRGDFTEHIWITVLDVDGEVISGRLANEPYDLAGLKLGSTIVVRIDAIDDWEYTIDGKTRGYFTKAAVEGRK